MANKTISEIIINFFPWEVKPSESYHQVISDVTINRMATFEKIASNYNLTLDQMLTILYGETNKFPFYLDESLINKILNNNENMSIDQ